MVASIEYLLYVTALVLVFSFPCIVNYLNHSTTAIDKSYLVSNAHLDVPDSASEHETKQSWFVLVTTFGGSYSPERLQEVITTLSTNANLASVAKVFVLTDAATMVSMKGLAHNPKIVFLSHMGQPTYQHLFSTVNERTGRNQLGRIEVPLTCRIYVSHKVTCRCCLECRYPA
jgi:hypothetical protein